MLVDSVMNYNYGSIVATQVKEVKDLKETECMQTSSCLDIKRNYINIEGIDKDALLYALWFHAKPQQYGCKEVYDAEKAKKQLCFGYAYIICGRVMKCDIFNSNYVDNTFYDNENGDRMFIYIVNSLRYNV